MNYREFKIDYLETDTFKVSSKEGDIVYFGDSVKNAKKYIDEIYERERVKEIYNVKGLGRLKNSNAVTNLEKNNGKWFINHYSSYADKYPITSKYVCDELKNV
jgi:hypoxanthine phosphoribosyltransferase